MNERLDAIGLATAKAATYGGGASAFVFGMSASEFAAMVGAVVAVLGWLTQIYFNRKRARIDAADRADRRAEFEARMEDMRRERGL